MSGTIDIKPLEAKLSHDTETFGKMDPFCQIVIGDSKVKGQVCHSGGKFPRWNDTISVNRNSEPSFYIEVIDKDTIKSDIIGVGLVDIHALSPEHPTTKWYPLYYKKKPAGEVLLEITYKPNNQAVAHSEVQHHDLHREHYHYGNI